MEETHKISLSKFHQKGIQELNLKKKTFCMLATRGKLTGLSAKVNATRQTFGQ